jgi:hypothetical protein
MSKFLESFLSGVLYGLICLFFLWITGSEEFEKSIVWGFAFFIGYWQAKQDMWSVFRKDK